MSESQVAMQRFNGKGSGSELAAGALAGALGVWVMDRVDWFNFRHEDPQARRRTRLVRPGGEDPGHVAASALERAVGVELSPARHEAAGNAIHYAIGIAPAALYGLLRHRVPGLSAGRGTLFGLGLFLLQDEGINAITGLSADPRSYPWQAHARGLVAHLVFGLAVDSVLRALARRTRLSGQIRYTA